MGKYLRPRRGNENEAVQANIRLLEGEIFIEYPEGRGMGKSPGRIIIGNGVDTYNQKVNSTTETDTFQPFITDPSLYKPIFEDSGTKPDYKYDDTDRGTSIIARMVNGIKSIPELIGLIKKTLCEHTDNLKYDDYRIKEIINNLVPGAETGIREYIDNKIAEVYSDMASTASILDSKINSTSATLDSNMSNISILNIEFWSARADGYYIDQQGRTREPAHNGGGMIVITAKNKSGSTYEIRTEVNDAAYNITGLTGVAYYSWLNSIKSAAYHDADEFAVITHNHDTIYAKISNVNNIAQGLYSDINATSAALENEISRLGAGVIQALNDHKASKTDHAAATTAANGFMSAADKAKLDRL